MTAARRNAQVLLQPCVALAVGDDPIFQTRARCRAHQGCQVGVGQCIAARAAAPELLETLAHALPSPEDRLLALKLSFMMVLVGRAPGDREAINPREKATYRRLVEALALPQEEVEAQLTACLAPGGDGIPAFLRERFASEIAAAAGGAACPGLGEKEFPKVAP